MWHIFKALLLLTATSSALNSLQKRQQETCAESFGPGYVDCGSLYCYNPGRGEVCCADGSGSCDSGTYCATAQDGYPLCCDIGDSLRVCGAVTSVSGLPDPTGSSTAPVGRGSSSAVATSTAASSSSSAMLTSGAAPSSSPELVTDSSVSPSSSVAVATGGAAPRYECEGTKILAAAFGALVPFL